MQNKFTIEGRLPGLNEIIAVAQRNRFAYGTFKKRWTNYCATYMMAAQLKTFTRPIDICVYWIEPNNKRDIDNISAGIKFILDALVQTGRIKNDTRQWVHGLQHEFRLVDKEEPRVEITILENDGVIVI